MQLARVTITGADESVSPADLARLTDAYPFVEWGILVSKSSTGIPRYPHAEWIDDLCRTVRSDNSALPLALHVCGQWVRKLLVGENVIAPELLMHQFPRVQLNFHAENVACYDDAFFRVLTEFPFQPRQFIFQLDGKLGNRHFDMVRKRNENSIPEVDAVPLFDISGGAGRTPKQWPDPVVGVPMGYAGGLGPANIEAQLLNIAEKACGHVVWVDMETHVRSEDDRQLDLTKVEAVLEICARFRTVDPLYHPASLSPLA